MRLHQLFFCSKNVSLIIFSLSVTLCLNILWPIPLTLVKLFFFFFFVTSNGGSKQGQINTYIMYKLLTSDYHHRLSYTATFIFGLLDYRTNLHQNFIWKWTKLWYHWMSFFLIFDLSVIKILLISIRIK